MKMSRTFFVERDIKQVVAKTTIEKGKRALEKKWLSTTQC